MNNCRAGLYSFASTTTWLHETGIASPPFLVVLGLTLPDSRILSGIASIGLTLANIAIILPHLRQPILDSMRAHEGALAHEQPAKEQTNLAPDVLNAMQPAVLNVDSLALTPVSPCERDHQSPPLPCSATVKSVCSVVLQPLGCLNVDSEVAPHTTLLPPAGKIDDGQIPPKICPSLDADSSERHVSASHLFVREGRDALHIPLPAPDAAEVAFFDAEEAALSNGDLGAECPVTACEQHAAPEENSTIEDNRAILGKVIEQEVQLVTADLLSTQGRVEIGEDPGNVAMSNADAKVTSTPTKVSVLDHHSPVAGGATSDLLDGLPARGDTIQSAQARHPLVGGKEVRRPESLDFIPQSVIRRYPSAPMTSAGHCFGHRAFSSGHGRQVPPAPPHIFAHKLAMPLEGTGPWASCTKLEGHWRAPFLTEVHTKGQSMGEQTFVIETAQAQDPLKRGPASLPEPSTVHELTALRKYPTHRRRLGVLARAALRDRRSAARRRRHDGIDGSSASDSDSDFDSDSQDSSGSSADESMLPHMLGADLIAAIDANSESELNLAGSRRTMRTPLDVYEDFLIPEDSVADFSMIMHVSSNDDASDGEVRPPATFRALTYDDIQQWASGVVQKCVRQVCRSRVPAEPSSPSQASDVCAERPSGSGASQCPLSGLHCKLGAAALTEVPAPRPKEMPVSDPATSIPPSQKPLPARNLRAIPEFVPRQRQVPIITRRVEVPQRLGTRSAIDVTRDAATQVIARMESQATFNTRQWLVGTEERRMVSTAGGRQGMLRCA